MTASSASELRCMSKHHGKRQQLPRHKRRQATLHRGRTRWTDPTDGSLLLSNGLISRRFVTSPNFATVSLTQEVPFSGHSGAIEMLRGVSPEARIQFDCSSSPSARRGLLRYAHHALEGNTTTEHGGKNNWANSSDGGVEVERRVHRVAGSDRHRRFDG